MTNYFDNVGLMVDCSRNAVMSVDTVKKLLDLMQIMGYNSLQLYTEETYEVEKEPYFGYKRGRYSIKEFQELDSYAKNKGIKLIPCIQTLAHLNCIFRWPVYYNINDLSDVLLIDEPKTYELIDHMMASLRKGFTSDIIHIGMDEAWLVGQGAYYLNHGAFNRFELLLNHLNKVCDIARKYGFKPILWSDMFVKSAKNSKDFDYDNAKCEINKLCNLIYWDYYSTDYNHYKENIELHHKLCDDTWFAGGFWMWSGFAPLNDYSIEASKVAIKACKDGNVRNIFFTMWGDNGGETSPFSVLPSMFYVSCLIKGIEDEDEIKALFKKTFNVSFDDFMLLDSPNHVTKEKELATRNPSKYMLYNDVFLGIYDKTIVGGENKKLKASSKLLHEAASRAGEYKYLFDYMASLCDVLEIKYDLGLKTRKAYPNKEELKKLIPSYTKLIKRLETFYDECKQRYEKENKPYGFEVQDIRLGGLIRRISHCKQRLLDYINGNVDKIDELLEDVLPVLGWPISEITRPFYHNAWSEEVTACVIG